MNNTKQQQQQQQQLEVEVPVSVVLDAAASSAFDEAYLLGFVECKHPEVEKINRRNLLTFISKSTDLAIPQPDWLTECLAASDLTIEKFYASDPDVARAHFTESMNFDPRTDVPYIALPDVTTKIPTDLIMRAMLNPGYEEIDNQVIKICRSAILDDIQAVRQFPLRRQFNCYYQGSTNSTMMEWVAENANSDQCHGSCGDQLASQDHHIWFWDNLEYSAIERSTSSCGGYLNEIFITAYLNKIGGCPDCKSELHLSGGTSGSEFSSSFCDMICPKCYAHFEVKTRNAGAFKDKHGDYKYDSINGSFRDVSGRYLAGSKYSETSRFETYAGDFSTLHYRRMLNHYREMENKAPYKNYLVLYIRENDSPKSRNIYMGEITHSSFCPAEDFGFTVKNPEFHKHNDRGPIPGKCTKTWIGAEMRLVGQLPSEWLTDEMINKIVQPIEQIQKAIELKHERYIPKKDPWMCRTCYGLGFCHLKKCNQPSCRLNPDPRCTHCQGTCRDSSSFMGPCPAVDPRTKTPCEWKRDVPEQFKRFLPPRVPCGTCKQTGTCKTQCRGCVHVNPNLSGCWCRICKNTTRRVTKHPHLPCGGRGCKSLQCENGKFVGTCNCAKRVKCKRCNGTKQFENPCHDCNTKGSKIAVEFACKHCDGSGNYVPKCRSCSGDTCERCRMTGKYMLYISSCNACQGSGVCYEE